MTRTAPATAGALATVAVIATVLSPSPASAQNLEGIRSGPAGEPPLVLPRLNGPITLDGIADASEWEGAVVLGGVMHLPDFGADPSEPTAFLLGHDGEYLYFACRSYDSSPEEIRVTTLQRDISTYNTDACGIRLDSYNDEENALLFNITPAGVRTDWTFANDAQGPPNQDWDAFWDGEGSMTEGGWSGEIRIPFSTLGFQEEDGRVVMGFALARSIVRRNETIVHPAIPPNWGPASIAKPSQMRKLVITGIRAEEPVYVTPYALAGGGHSHTLDQPTDAAATYVRDGEGVLEVGGDVKYNVSRNLTLDLTANTDFAQVEADDQQVNLTRFSLFFPEQRRFFQERAAVFEFPLSFQERLFHSRRIGLVGGEQVRIYGGGRMVGRVGNWDVGLLDMQTAEHVAADGTVTPSENMGVARLRRRVLNDFSYVGGILTSRVGTDGSHNLLYGTDGVFRIFGQDYLTVNWAQSFDDRDDALAGGGTGGGTGGGGSGDGDIDLLERSLVRVEWQRRGTDGLTYRTGVIRAGDVFEPGMGFLRRRDYLNGIGQVGYGWRPGAGSALNRYSLGAGGGFYRRNEDRTIQSADYGLQGQIETRGGHGFDLNVARIYEDLTRPFSLSEEAGVPVGSYGFTEAGVSYNPPSGAIFRPSLNVFGGQFYDGTRYTGSLSSSWSLSRHLRLDGTYELNHVEFEDRGQEFTAHILRLRTEVTFTTATSASAFVQHSSAGDFVIANLRFHYNPREGNDFYIVWNETLNSDRFALDPVAPLSQRRALLVKYAHTFTLGL